MQPELTELEDIITNVLRNSKDLKNLVDRKEIEKHDLLKEIALGIIDIIDSFERVEEGIIEKGYAKNEDVSKTMIRYKTIPKKLLNLLSKNGITRIEFQENRLIVGLCEVVETEIDSTRKNDEIVSIVRNGYIRGNELIRAAQVIIVKN